MRKITEKQRQQLIKAANRVRANAYAPYSNYAVGAALLTSSGKIFRGANVENAAYPVTMCAERSAVFSAVAAGEQEFNAIAVATDNGGTPCGSCRQVLAEFGLDIKVLIVDGEEKIVRETTVEALLPGAFSGGDLPDS
ncbi:MAG: Cytidine deaminase [Chloroflexi bacterium]|nr:Cytidine deaminase [Chloroflexota bacterium]